MSPKLKEFCIVALRWVFLLVAIAAPPAILLSHPQPILVDELDVLRVTSWLICLAGVAAIFVQAGLELRGRVFGVLIDERNRFSLSRLQITLWSVLVLGTLYVTIVSNMVRDNTRVEPLNVDMDWNLILLMGISVASFVTSPLALSLKSDKVADQSEVMGASRELQDTQQLARPPKANGTVMIKQSPRDARIADLIRGEEVGNATVVDISRAQMLIITLVVVTVYALEIWRRMAFTSGGIQHFPELSQTMLGLIFISHAGYLTGKLTPTSRGEAGAGSAKNVARALQASQRAADLVRDLETRLAMLPDDGRAKVLQDSLTLARSAAAQASALPTRVTDPNFREEEISTLEGRIEALSASVNALAGAVPMGDIANAPATQKVLQVQRILRDRGHDDVGATGIPDARTENAIQTELKAAGVDRKDLHPRPFRYYEELVQILT